MIGQPPIKGRPLPQAVLTGGTCALSHGIILIMKSAVLIALSTILVSIACTYKSAGSQPVTNNSIAPQVEAPGNSTSRGQEKATCPLTLAASPIVNGLRLGMTPNEVFALFPGSKDDREVGASLAAVTPFGNSTFVIKPALYGSKEKFAGINQITFKVLDGRISSFSIGYNGPEYTHVDKFVAKFSEGRSLPPADQWDAYVGMDTQMKTLKCTEFEVQAFAGGPGGSLNHVLVQDMVADRKLRDRKAKARAKASPTPGQ
jgi:hypothetical protein